MLARICELVEFAQIRPFLTSLRKFDPTQDEFVQIRHLLSNLQTILTKYSNLRKFDVCLEIKFANWPKLRKFVKTCHFAENEFANSSNLRKFVGFVRKRYLLGCLRRICYLRISEFWYLFFICKYFISKF